MIETGTLLQGRFLIEKELARGGMGAVYLATDQKFGSRVAIKERFYEDAHLAEAFAREARILNCLHHPILPHVSDYFSEGAGHFLVMEYIEGEDLSEILKREGRAFPVTDVLEWMTQLLDGLDYLHSQDPPIVHRDIKPGNLKLTSRGNLVLLDFGLAKETSGSGAGVKSVFGYSRRYSPLEQIEGAGTSPRSDLFSLGATCFHLITGEPPIDVLARASAIVAGRPDPLRLASDVNEEIEPATAQVIYRAMALDQAQRFGSAREMSTALYAALDAEPQDQFVPALGHVSAPGTSVADIPAARAVDLSTEELADGPEDRADDTAPVTTVHLPPSTFPSSAARPSWLRPMIGAAIVLIAVTILGLGLRYAGSDSTGLDTGIENANETATSAPNIDESQASSNDQVLDTTLSQPPGETNETGTNEGKLPEIAEVEPAVIEKSTARRPTNRGKQKDVSEKRGDEIIQPVEKNGRAASVRRDRRERLRQARRQQQRRDDLYEPHVSSIEMIFTGVPPERRRRYRRWRPYQ